jgi:Synergist-CTERM protein sorting domain-containing protein
VVRKVFDSLDSRDPYFITLEGFCMNKKYAGKFLVKKFLAALSVVFLLCGAAAADIVYTTSDYIAGTGTLGVIDAEMEVKSGLANLTGDAVVFSFSDGGSSRVAVVERNYTVGDTVIIYDPRDWTPLFNERWSDAMNIHGIASSGGMLYAACYASRGVEGSKIIQASTSSYKLTEKEYVYPTTDGYIANAEKVVVFEGYVYALFSRGKAVEGTYPNDYEYAPSKLVKLTMDLGESVEEWDVGANAVDMAVANSGILVAFAGGSQTSGTVGGIQIVNTKTGNVENLTEGKDLVKDQMIMGVCYVNETCLYFIGQQYAAPGDWTPVSKLYRWAGTMDAQTPITEVLDISSETGYSYQVAYDARNDKIVTLAGDEILVINRNDTLEEDFSSVALGGGAYSLTLVNSASGGNDDGGSSGCNAGLTAFLLALVLPLALCKTRGKNR